MSIRELIVLFSCVGLTACATPSENFSKIATAYGFYRFTVSTETFEHQFYSNTDPTFVSKREVLHVYLDGDGSPWHRQRWLNDDPTSRNPMILDLMRQDRTPSILLGRPCYHGFSQSTSCHSKYWTSHRYSDEVVNSMAQALNNWLKNHSFSRIVLIGYSGGGTLGVLIAPHIANARTVVTLAANLDVEAWSLYHGYSPLKESLNPATLSLNNDLKQIHIAGSEDSIVPAQIIKSYADKQVNALFLSYDGYDHRCCWTETWRSILEKF
ncbi:MAG: alpha/beta fold hydrolase [Gammaproteobacteria bacterium]